MNILIVKTSAIGDVTHTIPALHALYQHFPNAQIDWLVEEAAADLIVDNPYLNKVYVSNRKRWVSEIKQGKLIKVANEAAIFVKELRAVKYDLLIDFQGLLKSSMFIVACRAARKVGFGKGMEHAEHSYLFLNEKIAPVDMNIHAVKREKMLLAAIGVDEEGDYNLPITEESRKEAALVLQERAVDTSKPTVAINPMTTWPTKHWNKKGFAELADIITKRGIKVLFTGGKGDFAAINEIISIMEQRDQVVNLAGSSSLKTLAAIYEKATLVVSTDTGPMHIAAASGSPVIALFGPTAPWRTGPYGKQHKVIRVDLPCSPCLKKQCKLGTTACMAGISPAMVMAVVEKVLRTRDKGK